MLPAISVSKQQILCFCLLIGDVVLEEIFQPSPWILSFGQDVRGSAS
jgi:hypothetical protein